MENNYKTCINVNEFALRFLTRTANECTVETQVETQVLSISHIETSSRSLKHAMGEKLTFISTNGPHPIASLKVVEDAMNIHFKGKPWHFVLSKSKYYTSKVVDREIRGSENMANNLA